MKAILLAKSSYVIKVASLQFAQARTSSPGTPDQACVVVVRT